ncbi:MAG TPA: hypothetical protein PLK55_03575 [archaeon]|jgi:hypothetical protein|nr:hypothetical protein [archaeon]
MPKPKIKIHTKGNPITPLPEKNKVIFKKVIPTIRKIQEKRYWAEDAPGIQSEIDRKVNPKLKILRRMVGVKTLAVLSKKGQKDLNNFWYKRLKDLPEITFEDLKKLKHEAFSIIIKVKNQKFKNNLISKADAKKRLIQEELEDYDLLKATDKKRINTIINYNLALLNSNSLISFEDYRELLNTVNMEYNKFNLRYVVAKKIKTALLSNPRTKELLSYRSVIEQKKLFKYLDTLIREEVNIYSIKSQEIIKRQFISKILGLKK